MRPQVSDIKNAVAFLEQCSGRAQMTLNEHASAQAAAQAVKEFVAETETEISELKRRLSEAQPKKLDE